MVADAITSAPEPSVARLCPPWVARWLIAILLLATITPFLVAPLPPLVDLPGHMARYHVAADQVTDTALPQFYQHTWMLAGNLGGDLLAAALTPLLGVERAAWSVSFVTVLMMFGGIVLIARQLHGAVQPTTLLALAFIYSHMFLYGFQNYFLAVGLALLGFWVWLRLPEREWVRAAIFVPLSLIIWVSHTVGWALFCVLVGSEILVRQVMTRPLAIKRVIVAGLREVWPVLPPIILMALWRAGSDGVGEMNYTATPFEHKLRSVLHMLRDQSAWLDLGATLAPIIIVFLAGRRGYIRAHWPVLAGGLALAAVFVVLPPRIFTGFYADTRLVPIAAIIMLVSLRWTGPVRMGRAIAAFAILLLLCRLGLSTNAWIAADRQYGSHLKALDHVPPGARILVQVLMPCPREPWAMPPTVVHLGSMAVVRRGAFVNSLWQVTGANGLHVHYNRDTAFFKDPSQFVVGARCEGRQIPTLDDNLASFPRGRFDFVWILRMSPWPIPSPEGLQPVYADDGSVLLRVPH